MLMNISASGRKSWNKVICPCELSDELSENYLFQSYFSWAKVKINSNQNKSVKIDSLKHIAYVMRRNRSAWSSLECTGSVLYKYKTEAWGLGLEFVASTSRGQRLTSGGGLPKSPFSVYSLSAVLQSMSSGPWFKEAVDKCGASQS